MALLHSALAFLVIIAFVHAAPQVPPPYCYERPVKGGCRPVNESWYFDVRARTCVPLRNLLCAGGQGGFRTRQSCLDCQQNAGKKGPHACPPQPLIGGCQPGTHRWYFDPEYKHCRPFQSGECSRGRNHFVNEYKCREVCAPGVVRPPQRCQQPIVLGQCHALHNFWHFDYKINDCVRYPAGLCGAGNNMFVKKREVLGCVPTAFGQKDTRVPKQTTHWRLPLEEVGMVLRQSGRALQDVQQWRLWYRWQPVCNRIRVQERVSAYR
uniref:Pancreatic trypsin inhibitor n=1 Tax=Rhipicephalus zambeziensis TaxID=60191 RepID=A0A224Y4Y5_9ACAR